MTLWLDGWSVAALGSNTLEGSFLSSPTAFPIVFTPVTAKQVEAATASYPQDIARYASRLLTASPRVVCGDSGCSADGEPLNLSGLSAPSAVPVLGPTYQGAGVRHGLYVARVAVPESESFLTLSSPGGGYTLSNLTRSDANGNQVKDPWPSSLALSYGFGYLFPLTPLWGGENPEPYEWTSMPFTSDPDLFYDSNFSALFMYGLSDTYPQSVLGGLTSSLASYLTSPTVACGVLALCVTDALEPEITQFTAEAGSRCLVGEATSSGTGRVGLLQQDFTASVTLPYPTLVPGVSENSSENNDVFTVETLTPVSGPISFTQRSTIVADESGVLSVVSARNVPDPSFAAWGQVLPDQLGPCPALQVTAPE